MIAKIESVAHNIRYYQEVLDKFDATYHEVENWLHPIDFATIELLTLGDLEILQEELGHALVFEEGVITIYDGWLE